LKTSVDIAHHESLDMRIAHCMLPAWDADEYVSVSRASSLAISFTRHRAAVVKLASERCAARNIPANSIGVAGGATVSWIRVNEPSECLEVTASEALRRQLADELGVRDFELDDRYGVIDPIAANVMRRLRSLVRSDDPDALEMATLGRFLYSRTFTAIFGGRLRTRGDGGLNRRRLAQVVDWIEAHLAAPITIGQLAAVAALSQAHFIRSFKRSSGLSPYQFVRLRRLERARERVQRGAGLTAAAQTAGFSSISQFRAAYYEAFGHAPQHTPRAGARVWIHPGANQPGRPFHAEISSRAGA
jgi:AraC-like DNA-binding protein